MARRRLSPDGFSILHYDLTVKTHPFTVSFLLAHATNTFFVMPVKKQPVRYYYYYYYY